MILNGDLKKLDGSDQNSLNKLITNTPLSRLMQNASRYSNKNYPDCVRLIDKLYFSRRMFTLLNINWQSFLLGEEELRFLSEVLVRTAVMFLIILISLRIMGRRAIVQWLFEVALIISLGSATGDAMFYSKVGVLPTILVITVIVILYRFINHLMSKSRYLEKRIVGKTVRLIADGAFEADVLKKKELTRNELFAELRLKEVSQLGQVEKAYLEPPGHISIFFYPDDKVKFGLPIFPEQIEQKSRFVKTKMHHACVFCGHTKLLEPGPTHICDVCRHDEWVEASNTPRIK